MLRVKKVRADGVNDEMRDGLREQKSLPVKEQNQSDPDHHVTDESDKTVKMLARMIEKRVQAHAVEEHEDVTEEDRHWMPNKKIAESLAGRGFQELRTGHDRKRANVRPPQLRIMIVMVVVRTAPDAARAQRIDAKDSHEQFRHA